MTFSSLPPRDNQASRPRAPFIHNEEDVMTQTCVPSVDSVIPHEATDLVSCTLDKLTSRLPAYSWAQVFAAVDRLTRQATLRLSRTSRFCYVLPVGSEPPIPDLRKTRGAILYIGEIVIRYSAAAYGRELNVHSCLKRRASTARNFTPSEVMLKNSPIWPYKISLWLSGAS